MRKQTDALRENILFQSFYHFIFICHVCSGVKIYLYVNLFVATYSFKIYLYICKIKLDGDLFNLNVDGDLF